MTDKFTVHTPEGNWVDFPTLDQAIGRAREVVEKHGGQREVFQRVAIINAKSEVQK